MTPNCFRPRPTISRAFLTPKTSAFLLTALLAAQARADTWDGLFGITWSDANNWADQQPFANDGSEVVYLDAGTQSTSSVDAGFSNYLLDSITLENGSGTFGVSGNGLRLNRGLTNNFTGGTQTIANNLNINGNNTWHVANNATLVASGQLTGSSSITKQGGGTLQLTGNNSGYSGNVTLSSGTLGIGHNSALGSGTFTIDGSTTVKSVNASRSINNSLILGANFTVDASQYDLAFNGSGQVTGDRTITINGSGTVSFLDALSGIGGIIKQGVGTMLLSGNNIFQNGVDVKNGTLAIGHNSAIGSGILCLHGGTILADTTSRLVANNVSAQGSYTVGGSQALTLAGSYTASIDHTITVNNSALTTLSGGISSGNNITKDGSGTLVLSGNNGSFSGNLTINSGSVRLDAASSLLQVANIYVNSGTTLTLNSAGDKIGNGATLRLSGANFSGNGYSETLGVLHLVASSMITLQTGGSAADLTFGSTSYGSGTLTIHNWSGIHNGSSFTGGSDDRIFILSDPGATFLNSVNFSGYNNGAVWLSGTGELVPVPEPGITTLGLCAGLSMFWGRIRLNRRVRRG